MAWQCSTGRTQKRLGYRYSRKPCSVLASLELIGPVGYSGCSRFQTVVITLLNSVKIRTGSGTYHDLDIILVANRTVAGTEGNFAVGRICGSNNVHSHVHRPSIGSPCAREGPRRTFPHVVRTQRLEAGSCINKPSGSLNRIFLGSENCISPGASESPVDESLVVLFRQGGSKRSIDNGTSIIDHSGHQYRF